MNEREYETDDDEERAYFQSFEFAKDKNYPYGFKEFCKDFDSLILQALLQNRLDNMERDDE